MNIAQLLTTQNRSLRTHPGNLLLGPTGKRLWMDYMEPAPGFIGRADFIHKMNLPLLFTVRQAGKDHRLEPIRATWRPDQTTFIHEDISHRFVERKLITWDDQALSLQRWENRSDEPLRLELVLPAGACLEGPYTFPCDVHGITPVMRFACSGEWTDGTLEIAPGHACTFLVAAAVGLPGEERGMAAGLKSLLAHEDYDRLLDEKCDEYMRWFDDVPEFACSDEFMTKCWYYRFYILRKNLSEPNYGNLTHQTLYEGRAHAMPKTPYQPKGWEFSRLIPLSTPLHVTDARWLKNGHTAKEAMRALTGSLDENGAFAVTAVDTIAKEYANYAAWALYQLFLVHEDECFIREVLPAFKQDARSVYERMRTGDSLQIERVHALTGKEYQPSYWFFTNQCFPQKVRPAQEGYTPLKRVDRSIYMYLNHLGLSRLCRAVGDPEEAYFAGEAAKIKRDVLEKMWDSVSECFYDLHYETDAKAFVKNIVAYYPFWAEITEPEHLAAFKYLLSPQYFATGSGFASASADCPVYSSNGGWKGDYFKGRNGCLWNGPSWPYTTGIALDALARQSKRCDHRFDADFERYLHEYTLEHFRFGDINSPYLVEFYDGKTGEPLSDEPDYNHSFYVDLIIRHIAGIEPEADGIRFSPLHTSMSYFALTELRVRGHSVDVYYQEKEGLQYPDRKAGYTLLIDGVLRYEGQGTSEVLLPY